MPRKIMGRKKKRGAEVPRKRRRRGVIGLLGETEVLHLKEGEMSEIV